MGAQGLVGPSDHWSATFDAMNDMVCLLDREGTIVRCNRSMTEFLGRAPGDLAGKKCYEIMHGSRTFFEKCPYREMLRTGRRESFELPLGDRWYQITADPMFGDDRVVVGAVHVVRDVTDRRHAQDALAERSRWLVAISDLAVDLASLPGEADMGHFLAARLRELTGAIAVAFSEYLPDDRVLATRTIEFQPGVVRTLTAPLAGRLTGTRSPVSENAYREILASQSAARATLTEASFGAIPPAVDVTVRKLLGVDRFVGVAYVIEGALYGTSVIALKAGAPEPPREELETFANLGAVSLRRRRAEAELALQAEQIDMLFELSGDILGITDIDGVIRRVSPAWEAMLGHRVEDTEGHSAFDFIHPGDLEKTRRAVNGLSRDHPGIEFANRQRHRDGSYRLIEWRVTRFEDRFMIVDGRDITARAEAQALEQARLRGEADQARLLLGLYAQAPELSDKGLYERALDDAVTLTGSDIGFFHLVAEDERTVLLTTWNRKALETCTAPQDGHHPIDVAGNWADCVRQKQPVFCNDYTTSPDRKGLPEGHAPVRRFLSVPVIAAGRVTAVFGVGNKPADYDEGDLARIELVAYGLRKILDLRAAEAELRRASEYNRSLLEASLDPLVTIGADGMITDVNEATVAATGRTREELLGTDFADYVTEPDKARAGYQQVFREGSVRDFPLEMRHRDGSLTAVLYNATTYRDPGGGVAGVFAAARDVGELKRAEAEIRALNTGLEHRVAERTRELDAANRELQEFVYSVAHDLRTPLRAVDGFSLTVLEGYGDVIAEQGRSDLQRVRAAAQSMGQLIDALLSLSRAGHSDVDLRPVDLSAIARRVIAELREADPAREVESVIEDGLEVVGDAGLLDVVLKNLLGNAWKFTSMRPRAHIEFAEVEHDKGRAFLVRDDGAGFDAAYVHKLFTPFQRLHTVEEFPGTGIGLATVARVLERLGGSWWAEGEVGQGATFFFALPKRGLGRDGRPPKDPAGQ